MARVEVGNRHRRRAHRSLSVYFGVVALRGFGVVVAEKQPRHRKAAVAPAFGYARFLQQRQCAAARTQKNEAAAQRQALFGVAGGGGFDGPCAVGFAVHAFDVQAAFEFHAFGFQVFHHLSGQVAEIDVRSFGGVGGGQRLPFAAAFDGQRRPFADSGAVGGKFHFFKQLLAAERVEAFLQIVAMVLAHDQRHMGNGVDERVVRQLAFADQRRPKLAAELELFGNVERAFGMDFAVGTQRRVVQFAQGRMPRARVVPRIGRFLCDFVQSLDQDDFPRGFEFFQKNA